VNAQGDLFDPPAQVHSRTSREAAQAISGAAASIRARVYAYICENGPVTDEQIAGALGLNPSTERPRRIELVGDGLVMAHYELARTSSGRRATAWVRCDL
jgi:predicted ArsR family transcriptional regulator